MSRAQRVASPAWLKWTFPDSNSRTLEMMIWWSWSFHFGKKAEMFFFPKVSGFKKGITPSVIMTRVEKMTEATHTYSTAWNMMWWIMKHIATQTWVKRRLVLPLVVQWHKSTHTHKRLYAHKESESCSLLFLHFVGGSEVIKQLAVHLHEGLQHVVDQRHDGPVEDNEPGLEG